MIKKIIAEKASKAVSVLYNANVPMEDFQIEKTNPEFEGDFTLVAFPLARHSKKSPYETAKELGEYLVSNVYELKSFTVVKGFVNLSITDSYWIDKFLEITKEENYGFAKETETEPFVIEYSSPNTNKPLHLGHIRNNLLGYSIAQIMKANGKNVVKINLINDRGIHICKSMLAWEKWGDGESPESSGLKGDHLIGKYYVLFDKMHKKEIEEMVHRGFTDKDAFNQSPLMQEAQEMLRKWESADENVLDIWRLMNSWVYKGFDETYKRLGVDFDQTNYESQTYLQGKEIVEEGLEKGVLFKKTDGSVWIDLTNEGLDEKLLLRSDGTSVYMTQDIGTAQRRWDGLKPEKLMYVVGNEQIYHFDVLVKVLKKLGRDWTDIIFHLSYGMVELPEGRMKSREGTVVDADDLMDEMYETARKTTEELGKTEGFPEDELKQLYKIISLGALKYYILKVDPKKNMLFNPEESIDFNGNTGPFIQYTYARIQSVILKSGNKIEDLQGKLNKVAIELTDSEKGIIRTISEFPQIVAQAGAAYSPALIANYCFDLVKEFNHFYQTTPILKKEVLPEVSGFRLVLSNATADTIKKSMWLLGIDVPGRM